MAITSVLGIDPSLRSTALCLVIYDDRLLTDDKERFGIAFCKMILSNKSKDVSDAIIEMLKEITSFFMSEVICQSDFIVIESPSPGFNSAAVIPTAHISGGVSAICGLQNSYLHKPSEWLHGRKREKAHEETIDILGDPSGWNWKEKTKSSKHKEQMLDAASLALWWIKTRL